MICRNVRKTGKTCKNGYSLEIDCPYSKTQCLRDCSPACSEFVPDPFTPILTSEQRTGGTRTVTMGCCGGQ